MGSGPTVTATIRRVASVVIILVFIAACGSSPSNDNSGPVDITVNSNGTSDLTLFVSNQSYRDSEVDITVTLDGETIIDRDFNVGDQHNYIEHRIRLDAGRHTLHAATTTLDGEEVELSEDFTIDPDQQRYAALDYWHYEPTGLDDPTADPPKFTFKIQDDPIGFA